MAAISAICASSCRCASESRLLTRLELCGFRNLSDACWEVGAGSHILLGPNGAGKTSVLESVYLLATSRSFRTARLDECCRRGGAGFSVKGRVEGEERIDLEVGWSEGVGTRKRLNGDTVRGSEYLRALAVVCWSAEQNRLLVGGPRFRRQLLDQGAVSRRPAAVKALSTYRRGLEQKRLLLKRRDRGLAAWNRLLAEATVEIQQDRSAFVRDLQRGLEVVRRRLDLELPALELRYKPSPAATGGSVVDICALYDSGARRERQEKRVLAGPHRDELQVLWDGVDIAATASAGEKKLFGLLLSLARAEVLVDSGRQAILLLDDVDAELDYRRLGIIWSLVRKQVAQVLVTTSHESAIATLAGARLWRLERGRFRL